MQSSTRHAYQTPSTPHPYFMSTTSSPLVGKMCLGPNLCTVVLIYTCDLWSLMHGYASEMVHSINLSIKLVQQPISSILSPIILLTECCLTVHMQCCSVTIVNNDNNFVAFDQCCLLVCNYLLPWALASFTLDSQLFVFLAYRNTRQLLIVVVVKTLWLDYALKLL